jgi:hypothetical protein
MEKDWGKVQRRQLTELRDIQEHLRVPIFCTGDIFDSPFVSHETVNLALEYLPDGMICIPGNHDMPFHSMDEINKSAYGTLIEARKIVPLPSDKTPFHVDNVSGYFGVYAFPFGSKVHPKPDTPLRTFETTLAIIHAFIWKPGFGDYKNVSDKFGLRSWRKKLKGYDLAVFGDNHVGFQSSIEKGGPKNLFNGGTFFRRKITEQDYSPRIGLIWKDGTKIIPYKLRSCSNDKFGKVGKTQKVAENFDELLEELEYLGHDNVDFVEALKIATRNEDSRLVELIKLVLQRVQNGRKKNPRKNRKSEGHQG